MPVGERRNGFSLASIRVAEVFGGLLVSSCAVGGLGRGLSSGELFLLFFSEDGGDSGKWTWDGVASWAYD